VGGCEAPVLAGVEPTVKYHSFSVYGLTPEQAGGPRLVGSLTGAVASQTVTEAPNGSLRADGNRPRECIGRRELDCEADAPSRGESRAK
jgi:hypothetical protein